MKAPARILVIRRDNIGDLVLTTPLLHALREHYPQAWIGALTNSYNAPVLEGNPDLDAVYSYEKAKHRPDRSRIGVAFSTARLLLRLRRMRIDLAIVAGGGGDRQATALARWVGARDVIGFGEAGAAGRITLPVAYGDGAQLHAAEDVFRLLAPLGITGTPGPCRMVADSGARAAVEARLAGMPHPVVAVHISARRPRQQWPAERFAQLIIGLQRQHACTVLLLWAPGEAGDPRHPGDDAKARAVQRLVAQGGTGLASTDPAPATAQQGEPEATAAAPPALVALPTAHLRELAGALACCDLMICADGGAMHVAAALGKPVLALFGDSPVWRWRPWGVPQRVLAAPGGDLANLAVAPALEAAVELLGPVRAGA